VIAIFVWVATQSLENHITYLRDTNYLLSQSEERYRTLVELSPDMVLLFDPLGSIQVVNRAGLDLFGYTDSAEVTGRKIWDFVADADRSRALSAMGRILQRGQISNVEYVMRKRSGATFVAEISSSVLRGANGEPQAIIGLGRDITLRKKAEQELLLSRDELANDVAMRTIELRQTNQRLDDLVARGPVVIYSASVSEEHMLTFVSENVSILLGYDNSSILGNPNIWLDYVHPDDKEKFKIDLGEFESMEKVCREYRVLHRAGNYLWIRDEVKLARNDAGLPLELVGSWIDITRQKQTERAYQTLVESSLQGLVLFQNNKVILANAAFAKMVGYSLDDLLSMPSGKIFDSIHPDDRVLVQKNYQERLTGGLSPAGYPIRVVHEDGSVRCLEINPIIVTYHDEGAIQVTLMDTTNRVKAEQALRETQNRMEAMLNALPDLLLELDLDRRFCDYRAQDPGILYVQPEYFLGKTVDEVLPFEAARVVAAALDDALLRGYHHGASYELPMKDGSHSYELSVSTMGNRNSLLVRFIVLVRDVTTRKKSEDALRESEERYRILSEASRDLIAIIGLDFRIIYANRFLADSLGKTPGEITGQPISSFFPEYIAEGQQRSIHKVLDTGQALMIEAQIPFLNKMYWWSSWIVPIPDEKGLVSAVMIVSRDISQRKIAEDALLDANKFLENRVADRTADLQSSREKLRNLARQVVSAQEEERRRIARELHDESGQTLIGLKFGLDDIYEMLPDSLGNIRQKISRTIDQVDDLNCTIRDLAHNLRPSILDVAGINLALGGLCQEYSEQTDILVFYRGVELLDLTDQISITLYRFAQEALTNVVKHAHSSEAHVNLYRSKNLITLSVKDNGNGFDPSFTPKDIGLLGMEERLGLLGGRLEIYSKPGRGSHFKAIIPAPK
jgi:PAS domain S-box-containing protein